MSGPDAGRDRDAVPSRRLIGVAVVALLLTGLAFAVGLSGPNALLLGIGAVVTYGLRYLPATDENERWPNRSDDRTDQGARREVARLSWNLQGFENRVERGSVRRLRRIAAGRLAEQGLLLDRESDAEACRRALGDRPYAILTAEGQTRPTLAEFTRAVTAVEVLERATGVRSGR